MYAFCYGTLKQGYGNGERLLSGRSTFIGNGLLHGYKLFDSGFPVATPSEGDSVSGEIFLIDDDKVTSVLRSLDNLEGYVQDHPEISMYHRVTVSVIGEDQEYECQTYKGNPSFWNNFRGMREVHNAERIYTWSR